LLLDFDWEIKADSDHHTFYSHDIPFVMMHTGMHGDYHRPSDDADKINNEGLRQIAQLIFRVLVGLSDAPELSGFRRQARQESRSDQQAIGRALPPPPGRLGVGWDEAAAKKGMIVITGVKSSSAAAKAGLRNGDRVLEFGGHEINDLRQFRLAVLTAKNPVSVTVQRPGEASRRELSVDLPGEPVRLGISWRTDDAEPGCVIINRLTPGSPADLANLRVNDRIHRIGGQEFATGEEFRRATAAPGALVLEVESSGRVRSVEIPPIDAPLQDPPQSESAEPEVPTEP
jgi:S1-C subfamily serine protease